MKKSTFAILFIVKPQKVNAKGLAPIYCRITIRNERAEFSTHVLTTLDDWNEYKTEPFSRKPKIKELRMRLMEIETSIRDTFLERQRDKSLVITATSLKRQSLSFTKPSLGLLELSDLFMKHKMSEVGKGIGAPAAKKYATTFKYLKQMIPQYYRQKDILLRDIKGILLTDFGTFLRDCTPNRKNSVVMNQKRLKTLILFGYHNGYMRNNPFHGMQLSIKPIEATYLEPHELAAIENREFTIDRLNTVKDIFLFSCYTGLAYADVSSLTKDNLTTGEDGASWITKYRTKTKVRCEIRLFQCAKDILAKYSNSPDHKSSKFLLPKISNQKYNSYLKEIADLCGITKNLTTHCGRHTFATTLCAGSGVPIDTAKKMLGHTRTRQTEHYYRTLRDKVDNDMQIAESKFEAKMNYYKTLNKVG